MFLVVFVCLFVRLSVRQQDYLESNKRICMKLLPELFLGPSSNPLNFGDELDCDRIRIRLGDGGLDVM